MSRLLNFKFRNKKSIHELNALIIIFAKSILYLMKHYIFTFNSIE
jgi:hypothetical protein